MDNSSRVWLVVIVICVIIGGIIWYRSGGSFGGTQTVNYSCNGGKTIVAQFSGDNVAPAATEGQPPVPSGKVKVSLSDGRILTLPRTISADGMRYANGDESFVFWSRGNGALVLENNQEKSYIGCVKIADAPAGVPLSKVYSNGSVGFSVRLPEGYTTDESYRYQLLGPGKDISGVKFTVPASLVSKTNLSGDTYVSIETLPRPDAGCSAPLFLENEGSLLTWRIVNDNGVRYSMASTTGAGAGNLYEDVVYALPDTNPCIAVRYFIHSGNIANYPAGAVKEFDRAALLATFDAIRKTLTVVQ